MHRNQLLDLRYKLKSWFLKNSNTRLKQINLVFRIACIHNAFVIKFLIFAWQGLWLRLLLVVDQSWLEYMYCLEFPSISFLVWQTHISLKFLVPNGTLARASQYRLNQCFFCWRRLSKCAYSVLKGNCINPETYLSSFDDS